MYRNIQRCPDVSSRVDASNSEGRVWAGLPGECRMRVHPTEEQCGLCSQTDGGFESHPYCLAGGAQVSNCSFLNLSFIHGDTNVFFLKIVVKIRLGNTFLALGTGPTIW